MSDDSVMFISDTREKPSTPSSNVRRVEKQNLIRWLRRNNLEMDKCWLTDDKRIAATAFLKERVKNENVYPPDSHYNLVMQ
jgi:hypothetical protein